MKHIKRYSKKRIFGFSLVEVMIAATILAMGSISVFQLFTFTTRSTIAIYNNSVALNLARTTLEQIEALGASKFGAQSMSEVKTDRNRFTIETGISKLSKIFSQAEVTVKYKESGRDVKLNLSMIVYN
jgi:prepilin-type N-terminal cleavage/methylation domain-containing protein